jgi:hypothetical protein
MTGEEVGACSVEEHLKIPLLQGRYSVMLGSLSLEIRLQFIDGHLMAHHEWPGYEGVDSMFRRCLKAAPFRNAALAPHALSHLSSVAPEYHPHENLTSASRLQARHGWVNAALRLDVVEVAPTAVPRTQFS